jgi:hypothetical protein
LKASEGLLAAGLRNAWKPGIKQMQNKVEDAAVIALARAYLPRIARHKIDRFRRQQAALSLPLPPLQQHLAEPQVISCCRVQTRTTRLPRPRHCVVRHRHTLSALRISLGLRHPRLLVLLQQDDQAGYLLFVFA